MSDTANVVRVHDVRRAQMTKIVVTVVFQSWDAATAASDELRKADYDVLIADDVVDLYSNAAFAEAYRTASPERADAIWNDVARIVEPFRGDADSCGPIGDDHVPFSEYRRDSRWWPVRVN
jgi:hypothetical protein